METTSRNGSNPRRSIIRHGVSMGEEIHRPKGDRRKKSSREIRIKTERHQSKERPNEGDNEMMDLLREIARQQGFDICPECNLKTPLDNSKCVHCHS